MSYDMNEVAIRVNNVTKAYKIFDTPGQRFLYHMFHTRSGKDFIALDNVSFEVKRGESFGIIGRNGSGKSTMLQILAGILKATSGEVTVRGRVAALLELGSGFNMESTGYENIYMNAAILGVPKEDIDDKVDRIIEFADIGDFINQPVKTYSSGMFVRLAFAVAINVDADILLIDEALAVGDVFFRQKCYKKLDQLKEEGKTIILVSHGMNEVEQFCDRVLLLNKSKVLMCGEGRAAVSRYYLLEQEMRIPTGNNYVEEIGGGEGSKIERKELGNSIRFKEWKLPKNPVFNCDIDYSSEVNTGKIKVLNIGMFNKEGQSTRVFHQGEDAYFVYEIETLCRLAMPLVGIVFFDQKNTIVFGKDNSQTYAKIPDYVEKGKVVRSLIKVRMDVAIGEYTFEAGFATIEKKDYDVRGNRSQAEVDSTVERLCNIPKAGNFAIHERKIGTPMRIMFHGCCDLPSEIELIVNE